MRQKKPLESTVAKYIDFLHEIQTYAHPTSTQYRTIQQRIKNVKINKSVLQALTKLEIIHLVDDNTWTWLGKEPSRELALEVLNFCLELNKKQIVVPIAGLDDELRGYIKEIRDHLINTPPKQNNGLEGLKTPLLSRALNQVEQSHGNHLFSQIENDEAKLFELVKTISGNCIDRDVVNGYPDYALSELITKIIGTSKTILSQLKH